MIGIHVDDAGKVEKRGRELVCTRCGQVWR